MSGQGALCSAAHGDILGCSPGEDSCEHDVQCLGTWSPCLPSCANKTYTVTRPSSGNGAACLHLDGASDFCSPHEGDCAPNVDCIGAWPGCDSACERTYAVHIPSSGTGVPCSVSNGFTEICPADTLCNDDNDQTMHDKCDASRQCAGDVVLGAQLVYSLDAATLPAPDSPDRVALDATISLNLATVMSAGGMICTASDIDIMSIGGGSVVIDYNVAVPPAFATPSLMASARAAIQDPASVGVPASAMAITVGGVPSGVVSTVQLRRSLSHRGYFLTDCLCLHSRRQCTSNHIRGSNRLVCARHSVAVRPLLYRTPTHVKRMGLSWITRYAKPSSHPSWSP